MISHIAKYEDMLTDNYRNLVKDIGENFKIHRKQWEFISIIQALQDVGKILPNNNGLGFGVGSEPLPSYFAKQGCKITATDQPLTNKNAANWDKSNQLCITPDSIYKPEILDKETFDKNVLFSRMDMNWIPILPDKFDFVWSACCLEHLGTLQHGLWFIIRTLSLLKPGGVAVHTTEFNLSSNSKTNDYHLNNIYRESDIEILQDTVRGLGYKMEVDFSKGQHNYDKFVDGGGWPGWNDGSDGKPHINLKIDGFDATSIILIIEKNV